MYFSASDRLARQEPTLGKVIAACDDLIATTKRDVRLTVDSVSRKLKLDPHQVAHVLGELAAVHVLAREEILACPGCDTLNDATHKKCTSCDGALDKKAVEAVYMRISDPDGSSPPVPAKKKSSGQRGAAKAPSEPPTPPNPWEFIKQAMKHDPAVRYVLLPTAVAAGAAIAVSFFKGDTKLALFATFVGVAFLVVGFVFSSGAAHAKANSNRALFQFFLWSNTLLFVASMFLTFTSYWFGWPRALGALAAALAPQTADEFITAAKRRGLIVSNGRVLRATDGASTSFEPLKRYQDLYMHSTDEREREVILDELTSAVETAVSVAVAKSAEERFTAALKDSGWILSDGQAIRASDGKAIAFAPFEEQRKRYLSSDEPRVQQVTIDGLVRALEAAAAPPPPVVTPPVVQPEYINTVVNSFYTTDDDKDRAQGIYETLKYNTQIIGQNQHWGMGLVFREQTMDKGETFDVSALQIPVANLSMVSYSWYMRNGDEWHVKFNIVATTSKGRVLDLFTDTQARAIAGKHPSTGTIGFKAP
jgi:hypothetical protein